MSREAGTRSIPVRGMYLSIFKAPIAQRLTATYSSPNDRWQLYAGWRTGIGKPGRPGGLPRTAAIRQLCEGATASAKKRSAFASDRQVAKPGRHLGDGADYKLHGVEESSEHSMLKPALESGKNRLVSPLYGYCLFHSCVVCAV